MKCYTWYSFSVLLDLNSNLLLNHWSIKCKTFCNAFQFQLCFDSFCERLSFKVSLFILRTSGKTISLVNLALDIIEAYYFFKLFFTQGPILFFTSLFLPSAMSLSPSSPFLFFSLHLTLSDTLSLSKTLFRSYLRNHFSCYTKIR